MIDKYLRTLISSNILKNGKLAPVPGPHCYFEDKQMLLHEGLMGIRDDVGAPLIEEIDLSPTDICNAIGNFATTYSG